MDCKYLLRQTGNDNKVSVYTIAKFDGKDYPTAVYEYTIGRKYENCNCPGFYRRRDCKHANMVKAFIARIQKVGAKRAHLEQIVGKYVPSWEKRKRKKNANKKRQASS